MPSAHYHGLRDCLRNQNTKLATVADALWLKAEAVHEKQSSPDSNQNGRTHIERVEKNIWRLLNETRNGVGEPNFTDLQAQEIFLLSCAACCHDFDKALVTALPDGFKSAPHGEGSAGFVMKNAAILGLTEHQANAVAKAIALHDKKSGVFESELNSLNHDEATSDGPINLQRVAVLLKAADILHCDESRISPLAVDPDKLEPGDPSEYSPRKKFLARQATKGWTADGTRILIQANPDGEALEAFHECFEFMKANEWSAVRDGLERWGFPHNLELHESTPQRAERTEKTPAPDPPSDQPPQEEAPADTPQARGIFGRDKEIKRISRKLVQTPILLLYGLTGIGKSKLIDEVFRTEALAGYGRYRRGLRSTGCFEDIHREVHDLVGCRDEYLPEPVAIQGRTSFPRLRVFAKTAKPAILYVDHAQHLFRPPGSGDRDGGFIDHRVEDLLTYVSLHFEQIRIILEARVEPPQNILAAARHEVIRVSGISKTAVAEFFRRPQSGDPAVGWELGDDDAYSIYKRLGGVKPGEQAHPLAMTLLAAVAAGHGESPLDALERHPDELVNDLNDKLFDDLYKNVLTPPIRHALRVCALHRDEIPHESIQLIDEHVGMAGAFDTLVHRCLLSVDERGEWYHLHAVICELTRSQIFQGTEEYREDHAAIAEAWLARLGKGAPLRVPNIRFASEAAYHFLEAEQPWCLDKLEVRLLSPDLLDELWRWSTWFNGKGDHVNNRRVVALIVALAPDDPKAHRFAGQLIEQLEGVGHDKALVHYKHAQRVNPRYPHNLANLGRCHLSRGEPQEFVSLVDTLDENDRAHAVNPYVEAIYARCLQALDRGDGASELRLRLINEGCSDPVIYADEADYLLKKDDPQGALGVLDKACEKGASDDYTNAIRGKALEALNRGGEASKIRQRLINEGSSAAVIYANEANYLLKKDDPEGAMGVLDKACEKGASSEVTNTIQGKVLEALNRGGEASELRQRLINEGSRYAPIYAGEAGYLLKKNDPEGALGVLDKAFEKGASNDFTNSIRGKVLEALNRGGEASRIRQRLINEGSRSAAIYNGEADYLLKNGDPDAALRVVEKAAQNGASDEFINSIRGKVLEALNRGDEASELRQRVINDRTSNVAIYVDEAAYLLKKNDPEGALGVVDNALENGASNDYTNSIRGKVLEALNRSEEASELRQGLINEDSRNAAIYADEGHYLLKKGDPGAALQVLERAVENGASNDVTNAIQGKVLEALNRGDEASELRQRLINDRTNNAAIYVDEAVHLLKKDDPEGALGVLDKALENGASDDYTNSIRGKVLEALNRGDEASV